MNSNRKRTIIAGVLYIVGTVAGNPFTIPEIVITLWCMFSPAIKGTIT